MKSLHGLRGIAVLYVLISHLGNAGLSLSSLPHNAIGKVGVWIFFVLSAFLLTHNMTARLKRDGSQIGEIGKFFIHRIFRIYPLYLVVLLLHVLSANLSWTGFAGHVFLREGKGELWAIPIEFVYYSVVPFIALSALWFAVRWVNAALVLLICASLISGLKSPGMVFSNDIVPLPKLVPFIMGSLLALCNRHELEEIRPTSDLKVSIIASLSIVVLAACTVIYREMFTDDMGLEVAPILSLVLSLAVVGLLWSAMYSSFLRALLSWPPIVKLGEISFSIYLLHMFFINGIKKFGTFPPLLQSWGCVFIVIVASSISYRVVEKPGIKLGTFLSNRVAVSLTSFEARLKVWLSLRKM
jgi:peptidoglycan/LPS O-acetylase OafA/YrhL